MDQPANTSNNQTPVKLSMTNRGMRWVISGFIIFLVGALSFLVGRMSVQTSTIPPTIAVSPTPFSPTGQTLPPTKVITPETVTVFPTNRLTPEPTNKFTGTCPSGYYQYGVPLGCVPTTYQCDEKSGGCPICLAGSTTIATPLGKLNVKNIKPGTVVWSVDQAGNRIATHVLQVSRRKVGSNHTMLHIQLKDAREVWVSAGHPAANGKNVEQLSAGDTYDGSEITKISYERYAEGYTYDILPAGETGFYFANDILMGSTLQ